MTHSAPFRYQPALDGLRCISVVVVLLFHHGVGWMSGGYLGVSVFFTLSGFLITSLFYVEHGATGRISPAAFYSRRVKRLVPASLACLTGVAVLTHTGLLSGSSRLRGDIIAAVAQVFNWHTLTQRRTYAELLGAESPVAHFWSLSVEEQFYWLWPLVMMALFAAFRSPRARGISLLTMFAVSAALARWIAIRFGPNAAYWATPARLSEILAGAALASLVNIGRLPPRRYMIPAASAAVTVLVWAMMTWPRASGPAYQGALPLIAVASAVVIAALQQDGALAVVLSQRPLVMLGKLSYGIYLFHWPIFVLMTTYRTGISGWALFAARVAATLLVATLSYVAVERPVRLSRLTPSRSFAGAATATAIAVGMIALPSWTTPAAAEPSFPVGHGFDTTPTTTRGTTVGTGTARPANEMTEPSAVPSPMRILVVGDSTARTLAGGFIQWSTDHPDEAQVELTASPGCGLMTDSHMSGDTDQHFQADCDTQLTDGLATVLDKAVPDIAVILITLPDAVDRTWADGTTRSPDDPVYEAQRLRDYQAFTDRLHEVGVRQVVWLTAAGPADLYYQTFYPNEQEGHVHSGLINQTIRLLTGVCTIDFAGFVAQTEEGGDQDLRSDGLHISIEKWPEVIDAFLWSQLIDTFQRCSPS